MAGYRSRGRVDRRTIAHSTYGRSGTGQGHSATCPLLDRPDFWTLLLVPSTTQGWWWYRRPAILRRRHSELMLGRRSSFQRISRLYLLRRFIFRFSCILLSFAHGEAFGAPGLATWIDLIVPFTRWRFCAPPSLSFFIDSMIAPLAGKRFGARPCLASLIDFMAAPPTGRHLSVPPPVWRFGMPRSYHSLSTTPVWHPDWLDLFHPWRTFQRDHLALCLALTASAREVAFRRRPPGTLTGLIFPERVAI